MTRGGDPAFLARWSRLKRGGSRPEEASVEAAPAHAETGAPEKSDAEILAEHDLPDPDALGPEDDVSGFMARAVPDRLRNRALRKLWLRNPVLANLDELIDYGEDYTDAALVVEGLASAWQAGRGYLPEPEPEPGTDDAGAQGGDRAEAGDASPPDEAPPPPTELPHAEDTPPGHGAGNAPAAETEADPAPAPAPPSGPTRRRRMSFRF